MSTVDEELYPELDGTDVGTAIDELQVAGVPCLRGIVYRRVSGAGWLHDGRESVTVGIHEGNLREAFLRLRERLYTLFGVIVAESADPSRPSGEVLS